MYNQNNVIFKLGKLLYIWGSAMAVSISIVAIFFTLFFGQYTTILNEALYNNHHGVPEPDTVELFTREGYGLTSYGKNGLVVNKDLNPDIFKVLFIGDSLVHARHVSNHEKFTEIVEYQWNITHPENPIQTVNMGLTGLDMEDYLSFGNNLDNYIHPELVILFITKDDFVSSLSKLKEELQRLNTPRTKPRPIYKTLVNQAGGYAFFRHLSLQSEGFLLMNNDQQADQAQLDSELDKETIAVQLEKLKEIWGERLVIIYYKAIPDLGKDPYLEYSDEILEEIHRQDIPIINLYQPFWQAFQERKPPTGFHNSRLGYGHLNQYGHQLTAEEILKFMGGQLDKDKGVVLQK